MKLALLLFIMQFSLHLTFGQSKEVDIVVEVEKSKGEIFEILKSWSNNYDFGTITKSNSEQGIIEGFSTFPVTYKWLTSTENGGEVTYNFQMLIKDNKYRIRLFDFIHKATAGVKHKDGGNLLNEKPDKGSQLFGKTWRTYQEQADKNKLELVKLIKKNFDSAESDW